MKDDILEKFGIKKLDPNALEFQANGKTYHHLNTISLARSIQYEVFLLELQTGRALDAFQNGIDKAIDALNNLKFVDAAVLLSDMKLGTEFNIIRANAALKICTLFICYEGEKVTEEITEEDIEKKIDDWQIEGYDRSSFFTLAATILDGMRQELTT